MSIFDTRKKRFSGRVSAIPFSLFQEICENIVSTPIFSVPIVDCIRLWAIQLAASAFVQFEADAGGVSFDNAATVVTNGASAANGVSPGGALLMLVLDAAIYGVLAWYLENVMPSEFGSHRSPLFFADAAYWREVCPWACGGGDQDRGADASAHGKSLPASIALDGSSTSSQLLPAAADGLPLNIDSSLLEPVSAAVAQRPGVHIRALRKEYVDASGLNFWWGLGQAGLNFGGTQGQTGHCVHSGW